MLNSPVTYVVEDILTEKECHDIIELGKNIGDKTDDIVVIDQQSSVNKNIRNTELYFFSDENTYQKIIPHINAINQRSGWNYSYNRIEPLQLGIYNENGHYDWHSDDSCYPYGEEAGLFKGLYRKLSFSILLGGDFEGGNFEIVKNMAVKNPEVDSIKLVPGRMILFPSFTPHRVAPVTKGTRISLVGWICGEPWR